MPCRYDPVDPRVCDRCGAFLWVAEEGLFCGECGVTMPCSMLLRPFPADGPAVARTLPSKSSATPNPTK